MVFSKRRLVAVWRNYRPIREGWSHVFVRWWKCLILTLNTEGLQQPLLQRLDFKREENANDCMTSIGQGQSKVVDPSIAANKFDKEKNNSSKEVKTSTTWLTLKEDGDS